VHLDRLRELTPEEIQTLWRGHIESLEMAKHTAIADTLTKEEYETMLATAKGNPFFILPVFKFDFQIPQGAPLSEVHTEYSDSTTTAAAGHTTGVTGGPHEMFLVNFQGKHLLLTTLHEYKSRADAASPYIVISFYDELLKDKGIVLFRVEILQPEIRKLDAANIVALVREFYINPKWSLIKWVDIFNNHPHDFNLDEFLLLCRSKVPYTG
jgi:hypothetical protein